MSWGRAAGFVSFFVLAAVACKEKVEKAPIIVGGGGTPIAAPSTPDESSPEAPKRPADPPSFAPFGTPDPVASAIPAPVPSTAPSAASAPDLDQPVVDAARVQAAGCFARLPPHVVGAEPTSRTASLHITVVPTGRVTRTVVNATSAVGGAPEPALVDCLRRVGDGLTFPPTEPKRGQGTSALGGELRSFTIDVTVTSAH